MRAIRPRFAVATEAGARIADAFANEIRRADVDSFARLLASDAVLAADGGGKVTAALRPIAGRGAIVGARVATINGSGARGP